MNACRDYENNSNRLNQATTTPEDIPSNDKDDEPKDEIEVNKVLFPTCRSSENKRNNNSSIGNKKKKNHHHH